MISINDWQEWLDYLDNFELMDADSVLIRTTIGDYVAPANLALATNNGLKLPKRNDTLLGFKRKAFVLETRRCGIGTFLVFDDKRYYNFRRDYARN